MRQHNIGQQSRLRSMATRKHGIQQRCGDAEESTTYQERGSMHVQKRGACMRRNGTCMHRKGEHARIERGSMHARWVIEARGRYESGFCSIPKCRITCQTYSVHVKHHTHQPTTTPTTIHANHHSHQPPSTPNIARRSTPPTQGCTELRRRASESAVAPAAAIDVSRS